MNNYARVNINGLNAALLIFVKSWVILKVLVSLHRHTGANYVYKKIKTNKTKQKKQAKHNKNEQRINKKHISALQITIASVAMADGLMIYFAKLLL